MAWIARCDECRPVPANQIQRSSIDRGIGSSASVKRLRPRRASSAEQATKWTPFFVHHDALSVDCEIFLCSPTSLRYRFAAVTPAMLPGVIC